MRKAIIWDAEFLTAPGAPQRFWCGPDDPDPILVQIGAVALSLSGTVGPAETFQCVVIPRDRHGAPYAISEFLTRLTGITPDRVAEEGLELPDALARFDAFTQGAPIWAWGTDELNAVAVSCYLAGIAAPIPATRFGNAPKLFKTAGIPVEDIHKLRSNTLCDYFGIDQPEARAHDALSDATGTALALAHLLRQGRLGADDFALPA
jgi:DNA polymerase III epsilon subunit-like protein